MNKSHLAHDWFSHPLPDNVTMGDESWLYSTFAFRHYRSQREAGVQIGHNAGVYHGTFFDLGAEGEVSIGDYTTVVGAIFATNGTIDIGDYCFLAHEVVFADTDFARCGCLEFDDPLIENRVQHSRIILEDNVWIGARSVVLGNVRIGEGAIVGAACVVREDVPPYTVYAGNPPRVVGGVP